MSDELRRALDGLVQDVADQQDVRTRAGDDQRLAAMTSRAHRNRVRRTALISAVTTCAVVAVAAGGVALATWDRAEPQPATPPTVTSPAPTPTPTPSSAPTPQTPAVALPAGDPTLPFGACGSVVDAAPAAPATDDIALDLSLDETGTGLGGPFVARTRLEATGTATGAFAHVTGPSVVVVRDGVVVATAPTYPTGAGTDVVSFVHRTDDEWGVTGSDDQYVSHVTPVVCEAPGSSVGEPLPAGDYEVAALSEVWTVEADQAGVRLSDGVLTLADMSAVLPLVPGTAVSGRVSLRVDATPVDPASVPVPPAAAPVLGDRNISDPWVGQPDVCDVTTTPGDAGGLLPVTGPTGTVGADSDLTLGVTHTGSGRVALFVDGFVRLVRDGQVVAASPRSTAHVDLDHAGTITLPRPDGGWTLCDGAGAMRFDDTGDGGLPSGTYTAYPVAVAGVLGLVAADGSTVEPRSSEGPWYQLVGDPFTLVAP